MKRKYVKWICVMIFMCVIGFFFLGAAPDPETAAVEKLLEKRADIMGNVLLGRITFEEGKLLLESIETDKLYRDDLESLKKYEDAEVDMVTDIKVIDLHKTSQLYDLMTFEGEIFWQYSGKTGSFYHKDEYHIGVAKEDDEYKLISFTLQ